MIYQDCSPAVSVANDRGSLAKKSKAMDLRGDFQPVNGSWKLLDSQGQLQPVGKRRKQPLPTAHPESRTQWMRVCISCGHAKVKTQDQHWDSLW